MKFCVLVVGILVAITGFGESVLAARDCPEGTFLINIGTVATASQPRDADSDPVSRSGRIVRASLVACAGTACIVGIHDADDSVTESDIRLEPGAPANTSNYQTYDPPIDFREGISVVDDGNVNAVLLYECR